MDVTGTIQGIGSEIKFDPDDLRNSFIKASARVSMIQTGIVTRDRHLQNADYFDSKKYPSIAIQSRSFRKTARQKFTGHFDLTIKDITKPVVIKFSRITDGKSVRYKGHFEIRRLEFGLGEESVILGDVVRIDLSLTE
jgi:polyisoprenoid-binding protein YceI